MRSVVLYKPGDPENLILQDRPVPIPDNGRVLIRIKGFGLNRSELMTRRGLSSTMTLPRVLGIECVGVVESDPSGDYKTGQKVAALMGDMGRDYDGWRPSESSGMRMDENCGCPDINSLISSPRSAIFIY